MEMLLGTGTLVDNRYRVVRQLGQGGFATVYEAEHTSLGRSIALKVLDTHGRANGEFLKRFEREARIAANFEHDNVVRIFDFGVVEQTQQPFMAMELLNGWDLEEELKNNGAMAPQRALRLFDGALDALAQAHARGVIHKDLKPSNLFLTDPESPDERLVILDFGIARIGDDARLTQTGTFAGTPAYLAPEYIQEQVVTPAFDVYQMGLILAEALSGEPVVSANSSVACLIKHVQGDFELPREILESSVGPVLLQATAREPGSRFQNAGIFHTALRTLQTPENLGLTGQKSRRLTHDEAPGFSSRDALGMTADVVFQNTSEHASAPQPSTHPSPAPAPTPTEPQLEQNLQSDKPEMTATPQSKTAAKTQSKSSWVPWVIMLVTFGGFLLVAFVIVLGVAASLLEDSDYEPTSMSSSKGWDPAVGTPMSGDDSPPFSDSIQWAPDPKIQKLTAYITVLMMTDNWREVSSFFERSVESHGLDNANRLALPPNSLVESWDWADVELGVLHRSEPRLDKLDRAARDYQRRLNDYADIVEEFNAVYQGDEPSSTPKSKKKRLWSDYKKTRTQLSKASRTYEARVLEMALESSKEHRSSGEYVSLASILAEHASKAGTALNSKEPASLKASTKHFDRALSNLETYAQKNPGSLGDGPGDTQMHSALIRAGRQLSRTLKEAQRTGKNSNSNARTNAKRQVREVLLHWSGLVQRTAR